MHEVFHVVHDLDSSLGASLSFSPILTITDPATLREKDIDTIIYNALFAPSPDVGSHAQSLIYRLSELLSIRPSSMHSIYHAFATNELKGFCTPALNIRTLTYDSATLIFRLMIDKRIGAVIFEISRNEMVYTDQNPRHYAVSVLAAAIKEGYQGPVFLQGDHFQFNKDAFIKNRETEIDSIKVLLADTIAAQFYNIDIDASTLVDLSQPTIRQQQQLNAEMSALLSSHIRSTQPDDQIISIGAEIGHIGDKNSSPEDLIAFMDMYQKLFTGTGISKVSVQTGSKHGGTLLPDGSLQEVTLDFSVLSTIGDVAKNTYRFGGVVQHGASTLPDTAFDNFVASNTLEVHLATQLQNIVYDNLPGSIAKKLSDWTLEQKPSEVTGDTNEQFIYKNRKRALGPFKKLLWDMRPAEKEKITKKLEEHLHIIFEKLRIFETKETILPYLKK